MFGHDGEPLFSSDKTNIFHAIESSLSEGDINTPNLTAPVVILDGMALVNKIHKEEVIKTWKLFSCIYFERSAIYSYTRATIYCALFESVFTSR